MAFRGRIGGHRLYRHRGGRPGGPREALRVPAQHRPVSARPDPAPHAGRQPAARAPARRHRHGRALGGHLPAARGWPGGSGLDPHPQAGRRPRRRLAPCRRPLRHGHPRARHPVGILRLPSRPARLAGPDRAQPGRRRQASGGRPPHLAGPRRGRADVGHGRASGVAGNERNSHRPRAPGTDRGDGVAALAALTGPARTARAAGQGPRPRGPASSPSSGRAGLGWARSGTRQTDAARSREPKPPAAACPPARGCPKPGDT